MFNFTTKNEARKNIFGRATNPNGEGGELSSPWLSPGLGCCFPGSEHAEPGKAWLSPGCSLKLGLQVKPGALDQRNELAVHGTAIGRGAWQWHGSVLHVTSPSSGPETA